MSLKEAVRVGVDHLGMPEEEEREGPARRTQIDRLPEPVQYEHLPVQSNAHDEEQLGREPTNRRGKRRDINDFLL